MAVFFRNIGDLATNDIKHDFMCLDLNRSFDPPWDKRKSLKNQVSEENKWLLF